MKTQLKTIIYSLRGNKLALLALVVTGLFVFWKTFQLEIYGDEWEGIWWTTSTWLKTGYFNERVGYKAYELAAILLNFVSGGFSLSYNSTQVYLFSFLTRLFAVFCLYYFLSKRKLSKIGVFVGCLLFLITPVGIQATDWAKNFTSYISIGFFLLCLNSLYELTDVKKILLFLTTFSLSVYINPIRAHGIIFTITFLLIIKLFLSKKKKLLLFSLFSVFVIFFILSKLSVFGEANALQRVYLQSFSLFINQLDLVKVDNLLTLVGRGILPNPSIYSIALLVIILFYWKRELFPSKYLFLIAVLPIFLTILIWSVFSLTNEKITALLGFYFILFTILFFITEIFGKKKIESFNTLIPFSLNLFFILIPFLLNRTDITDSTHRYLIYSALSIPIIVAFALKEFEPKDFFKLNSKSLFFCICLVIIGTFFVSIKSEVNNLYQRHNQKLSRVIWGQLKSYFNGFDFKKQRAVVYFDGDDGGILHGIVTFGFGYRMGFMYKIWDYDQLPIAVDSMKDLTSLTTDGKAGQKYIQKEFIFPKENAFYFRIEEGKVIRLEP